MARAVNPDSQRGDRTRYQGRLAVTAYASFSSEIVRAIATARAEEPTDTDISLFDHIDPDALNALYQHSQQQQMGRWALSFAVDEYVVTVQSDGYIEIT